MVYKTFGPLRTSYVYPPIPVRDYDWEAYWEDLEETGPVGRGPTEKDAIMDLLNQYEIGEEVNY